MADGDTKKCDDVPYCPRCGVARCTAYVNSWPCHTCGTVYCAACIGAFGATIDGDWFCNGCGVTCDRPECAARIAAWEAAHPDRPEGFKAYHCGTDPPMANGGVQAVMHQLLTESASILFEHAPYLASLC